jgi:hypothetical protein
MADSIATEAAILEASNDMVQEDFASDSIAAEESAIEEEETVKSKSSPTLIYSLILIVLVVIIAALILHDTFKHGRIEQKYTCADHPVIAYRMVLENMTNCPRYEDIAKAIHSHMGQWNKDYRTKREIMPKPVTPIERFVHTCDYLASRKYLEFNFDVEVEQR